MSTLSILRLHLLRAFDLVLVVGLGMEMWPALLHNIYSTDIHSGVEINSGMAMCMLWALATLSILGLRYPLQMLPLLFFEITWKAAWLLTVALPHWLRGQWNEHLASATFAVGLIALLIPLVPWSYVLEHYVRRPGDRWWRQPASLTASS
jgi:hypothetical protein